MTDNRFCVVRLRVRVQIFPPTTMLEVGISRVHWCHNLRTICGLDVCRLHHEVSELNIIYLQMVLATRCFTRTNSVVGLGHKTGRRRRMHRESMILIDVMIFANAFTSAVSHFIFPLASVKLCLCHCLRIQELETHHCKCL